MTEIYVGTSGWLYDWNEGATLDWYVSESGLNAVELNASFYRFPFRNQVASWSKKGRGIRWAVKVHRLVTHVYRFSDKAYGTWEKFKNLFSPMDNLIDFFLFQLPPNYKCSSDYLARIDKFHEKTAVGPRMAVEFRHESCFTQEVVKWATEKGLTLVSIDAPIATWIVSSNENLYLRVHGREEWYGYAYTAKELAEIAERIRDLAPRRVYVFFNNDHWMLDNARKMLELLHEVFSK